MRRAFNFATVILCGALFAPLSYAEEPNSGESPEIVIREEEGKTFYEYRVNGILKEIKVIPRVGKPYYLVPADGEGWIREDRTTLLVPKWVLFEW
jgi:Protein of unknown function (DUF2782)